MDNLYYDEAWVVTLSNNGFIDLAQSAGPFTGNGKLGVQCSMNDFSTQKTLSSGNVQFDQIGKYKNNTLETFQVANISFGAFRNSDASSNISYSLVHQKLSMDAGQIETRMHVSSNESFLVDAVSQITPLRQYPYCILQTVSFTPSNNLASLDVFHEVKVPESMSGQEFNNNIIYNENIYEDKGIYILNAHGLIHSVSSKASTASCYLVPSSASNVPQNLGFNLANDQTIAYQKFRYKNLVANTTYTLHVLSALMTSMDFPTPSEEVKRILLNIVFKEADVDTLVARLVNENKLAWDEMWTSDIELIPKSGITSEEQARVIQTRQVIRMSLFNMFACLRPAVNTEINPLNLSYLDANGNIFFDGDLWLIPALIFIKPQIARVMLEFKYKLIEQALQLSASFGYKGTKFPYKNDVMGYKNVYWDVVSPLHIFNNANICINVWNYYRVTLDREWLASKGYIMMKNIAEFITSYLQYTGTEYSVPNVLGLGSIVSDNHAFTINAILLALKYTIEASYVLNYIPNTKWSDILIKFALPTITSGGDVDVVKYHGSYDGSQAVDILDNLAILIPYYSSVFFNDYSARNNSAIQRNLNYYSTRLQASFETNALNNLIRAALYGVLAQTDTSKLTTFYDAWDKIVNENMVGYWGIMNAKNQQNLGNDVALNAFLILITLQCIGGLSIKGSTAPSNVVLEAFRIQESLGTFMPSTWAYINFSSIGNDGLFVNVSNQLPYP